MFIVQNMKFAGRRVFSLRFIVLQVATSGIMKKTVCANVCNFVSSNKGVSV